MKIIDSEIELSALSEAECAALIPEKSDEALAREYALMIENTYLFAEELNLEACPPDRRFYKGDREAWVYEHGNIAELIFVK